VQFAVLKTLQDYVVFCDQLRLRLCTHRVCFFSSFLKPVVCNV
jgi:hypothetical protein